jgi:hypothetical protein
MLEHAAIEVARTPRDAHSLAGKDFVQDRKSVEARTGVFWDFFYWRPRRRGHEKMLRHG